MLVKQMRDLERLAAMSEADYQNENPNYEPMFPKGWDDDKHWPEFKNDYDSFRKTQIEIDALREEMAGC